MGWRRRDITRSFGRRVLVTELLYLVPSGLHLARRRLVQSVCREETVHRKGRDNDAENTLRQPSTRDVVSHGRDPVISDDGPRLCGGAQGRRALHRQSALLELHGTPNEPVLDVRDVVMSMYPKDKLEVGTARPASVVPLYRFGRTYLSS